MKNKNQILLSFYYDELNIYPPIPVEFPLINSLTQLLKKV